MNTAHSTIKGGIVSLQLHPLPQGKQSVFILQARHVDMLLFAGKSKRVKYYQDEFHKQQEGNSYCIQLK